MNVSGKEPMIGCCCPCLICWNEVFSVVRVSFKYVSFQIVSFLCTSSIHQNGLHNRFCRWKMFKQQEQLSRISGLLQLQIWRTRNVNLCNRILYVSGQILCTRETENREVKIRAYEVIILIIIIKIETANIVICAGAQGERMFCVGRVCFFFSSLSSSLLLFWLSRFFCMRFWWYEQTHGVTKAMCG